MRRPGWGLSLLVAGTAAAAACSSNPPAASPFDAAPTSLVVTVRNQYELEVIVHALGPGLNQRLGSVRPARTARYEVPWRQIEPIRIRVEPATGPHFESNAVTAHPGDEVLLTIPSELTRTVLMRR